MCILNLSTDFGKNASVVVHTDIADVTLTLAFAEVSAEFLYMVIPRLFFHVGVEFWVLPKPSARDLVQGPCPGPCTKRVTNVCQTECTEPCTNDLVQNLVQDPGTTGGSLNKVCTRSDLLRTAIYIYQD